MKPRPFVRCWVVEIAKALILAGRTVHDRPWPSVRSGPKHLVPVANRPILFHNLTALRRAGLLEATLAIEPENEQAIMAAVGDGSAWHLNVRYVRWEPRSGISGALAAARDAIADEPVLVEPADALHREHLHPHIAAFAERDLDALALRLPDAPCSGTGSPVSGAFLLSRKAVSHLVDSPQSGHDPIAGVRAHGGQAVVQNSDGCLPCHGGQDRLLEANRRMLEDLRGDVDPAAYPSCEFQGPVRVHPTARLAHTLVRGPAVIGPGATLSHAYVGPYTSLGSNVTLDGSQIEHSVALEGVSVEHVGSRIESSVLGRGARITRSFALPSAMRLAVGDSAEVTLT